jgi:hypothetical protein
MAMDECRHVSLMVETLIDKSGQTDAKPSYSYRCTKCGNIIPIHSDSGNPIEIKLKGIKSDLLYLQETLADIKSKIKLLSLQNNTEAGVLDNNKKTGTIE